MNWQMLRSRVLVRAANTLLWLQRWGASYLLILILLGILILINSSDFNNALRYWLRTTLYE